MAGGGGEPTVAREQRSFERFRERDVDGIVSRQIGPQLPDTLQEKVVGISVQRKIREIGGSRRATVVIDLAMRAYRPITCATPDSNECGARSICSRSKSHF